MTALELTTTSARDQLEAALLKIERNENPFVFTRVYPEQARAAADAADARRRLGISLGPLDGALVSIKDLMDVAGEVTTAGSLGLFITAPARSDALVVKRLRRAGAVIIGKTNMSEFAYSGLGLNPHFGTPGNARDPKRIPGGSSAGAGVSVAIGTSQISIGTDTAGSVRIPAALNGVVGFKPTASRVPLEGVFPLSYTLDSAGPLARTVAECAAADAILSGDEPEPIGAFPIEGLRIGVPSGRLFEETEALVANAFETAVGRLAKLGARVAPHPIDDLLEQMSEATAAAPISAIEASEVHERWLDADPNAYDPRVRARIRAGESVRAAAYLRMIRRRAELVKVMDRRLRPIDVIALPTTPISAPLIESLLGDDATFHRVNLLMLRNTIVANLFDLTSISIPLVDAQIPAGLMLLARTREDKWLLQIAAGIEAALLGS